MPANLVMAAVSWNANGIIHTDYIQKERIIKDEDYFNPLDSIWSKRKCPATMTMQS